MPWLILSPFSRRSLSRPGPVVTSRDVEFAGGLGAASGRSARARAGLSSSRSRDASGHEPLGGQVPTLLLGAPGLSQGTGGPAAQPGASAGRGVARGEGRPPGLPPSGSARLGGRASPTPCRCGGRGGEVMPGGGEGVGRRGRPVKRGRLAENGL